MSLGTRVEHLVDTRSVGFGCWLYRRTRGRITRLWRRRALVLTTVGRRSGLPRTVLVQFFPDGDDFVVVAANSGLPRHPGWYFNLTARPRAVVEVEGRTLSVRSAELTPEEAVRFWPRVLAIAPDYARYRQRTDRVIPLIRLTPVDRAAPPVSPARDRRPTSGSFGPGMSFLRVGTGPPLLFLPGLTSHHLPPEGMDRRAALGSVRPLAAAREVWWVNRRAGLSPGVTLADLAADYATAIPRWFRDPVDVVGVSTGGSVALQLAADHPALVRRLVLVSAARLSTAGQAAQRQLARALESGDRRAAGAAMMRDVGTATTTPLWTAAGWLLGPLMFRHDCSDLLATIGAEDALDLMPRLAGVRVPVLVIGGDRDAPYGPALFARTADGLPDARLVLYRGTGHAGVLARRRFGADVLGFLSESAPG